MSEDITHNNCWVERRHSRLTHIVRSQPRDRSSFLRSLHRRRNTEKWSEILVDDIEVAPPPTPTESQRACPVTFPFAFWSTLTTLSLLQHPNFQSAHRRQILLMWPEATEAEIERMFAEELD